MIGITGNRELRPYVADLVDKRIASGPSSTKSRALRFTRLRESVECRIPIPAEVVEACVGIDGIHSVLRNTRVFLDCSYKVQHIVYTSLTGADRKQLLPCLEIMPRRKPISRS